MGVLLDLALTALSEDADEPNEANLRRQHVLQMLADKPVINYAVTVSAQSDPVILTLAIRDGATCEFEIDKTNYDPFKLLEIVQQHDGDAARLLLELMQAEGQQVH